MGLFFLASGALIAFKGGRKAAMFALLMQLSRCFWVFGNPWIYDKDFFIPQTQARLLALKYWAILGSLIVMMVKGKVLENHDVIDLSTRMIEEGANPQESMRNVLKGMPLKELTSGDALRSRSNGNNRL